ncbi:TPA: phosphoglycerate kinase [Candidatus Woesearchaeota archaeon]|nr:phosphoglycerate kinase [Candidatus Woesearchaeota archaeon]HIH54203.1 phosphoglycerate kinase [Candidatus Woesearchaeota archaeon]HIJ01624.1 phosphoglycerate kinase [Candidatus Woesearchaeota archaeon]HIJ14240.1 phosphoglycerate kinase [Candidatus Woesearchaeota archaeon]
MRTIKDIDFDNKRVLIRVGFNVPLDDDGNVVSDIRIKESIPTIKYILEHNAKQIILMSHLGRPDGKVVDKLKMDKVADKLEKALDMTVVKLDDCIDIKIPDAKIIMLENLRFHKEEEKNDEHFAERLSKLADIYVNDAFADMHRAHASTVGITKFMPGCIGFLVEKELKYLTLKEIERPFVAILGGAKISTKIPVIKELLKKVDYLLLGGAMIFTFYKAKGYEIGKSMFEEDFITEAKMLLNNEKVILPDDIVVAADKTEDSETHVVNEHQIPKDMIGLDIGPESIQVFKDYLKKAKTVFWNGPLGYFELEKFGKSTRAIAEYLADSDKVVIIGGGDTEDAILPWKDQYTHVSTGGGASLEFISGKELPAIQALKENEIEFHDVI